ncbi:MAG: S-methyl-5-thioribose-1-phosphate isomerase [Thermodesulfatator sp.]|nr:MAG: S-methyl-5-thioribose-1-phosphate isomerase [Thermodesulfatator sp.]
MASISGILSKAGSKVCPMKWESGVYYLLDQRVLPESEIWLPCKTHKDVFYAIRDMVVRGAPAIGITAAFGMVLALKEGHGRHDMLDYFFSAGKYLKQARPTAVNLRWAVDRMQAAVARAGTNLLEIAEQEALAIWEEDVRANIEIGRLGGELLPETVGLLTHCNAGALATGGYGTALGVARGAVSLGRRVTVYADETRPWLQGARLTCWELLQDGISVVLNVDNASGLLMRTGRVTAVVVGADRIAANGDVANKIGTYNVAVLAKENSIPFYVAAPVSTLDVTTPSGKEIPIEERNPEEVMEIAGRRVAPEGAGAANPVFDITPWRYVTAIITEKGILTPPYEPAIAKAVPE